MKQQATGDTEEGRAYLALKKLALSNGRSLGEILDLYVLEGFLARLAASPHVSQFVLKGGVLLPAYDARRPTRDVDFSARQIAGGEEKILAVMQSVAATSLNDGLVFDPSGAKAKTIRNESVYPGVRVSMKAVLASAQLSFHIDVTHGDPVWPASRVIALPRLLGGTIKINGYPLVMVLAEKISACVQKEAENTRWRDFADIRALTRRHDIDGRELCTALGKVTEYQQVRPEPLSVVLAGFVPWAQPQWTTWRSRFNLTDTQSDIPAHFTEVLAEVIAFADPALTRQAEGRTWRALKRKWER